MTFPNKKSTKAAPLLTREHPRYQRSDNVVMVTVIPIWSRYIEMGKGTRVSCPSGNLLAMVETDEQKGLLWWSQDR